MTEAEAAALFGVDDDFRIQEILVTVTYCRLEKHGYESPEVILPEFNAMWAREKPEARLATEADLLRAQDAVRLGIAKSRAWVAAHEAAP
jgi:hypothetical protein